MLVDALIVFLEVIVFLVLSIALLWLVTKMLGYIASMFEGEALVSAIRSDVADAKREVRRVRGPRPPRTREHRRVPSPG